MLDLKNSVNAINFLKWREKDKIVGLFEKSGSANSEEKITALGSLMWIINLASGNKFAIIGKNSIVQLSLKPTQSNSLSESELNNNLMFSKTPLKVVAGILSICGIKLADAKDILEIIFTFNLSHPERSKGISGSAFWIAFITANLPWSK